MHRAFILYHCPYLPKEAGGGEWGGGEGGGRLSNALSFSVTLHTEFLEAKLHHVA